MTTQYDSTILDTHSGTYTTDPNRTISEREIEDGFIKQLVSMGYEFATLHNYEDVDANFRKQIARFNAPKLIEAKGEANLSDKEFERLMFHVDNKTVYESAKNLRDKYVLTLDNEKTVYMEFFSSDTSKNIYQVAHQITTSSKYRDDVNYENRYDVTILVNGLPLVQIELKKSSIEIDKAINQINRYRRFSFKGLFHYLQLFVVSNSQSTKYFCNNNEKTPDGQYSPILKSRVFFWTDAENNRINNLTDFAKSFLERSALTEMIDKYMVIKANKEELMAMRPYQIYAVKAAVQRVLANNENGYVFACPGTGKTLTSFKLAQILRDDHRIEKVVFLIDRKDLDDKTLSDYNSYEGGCVDNTNDTDDLVEQFTQSNHKLIITTLQKMSNAITLDKHSAAMTAYKDKRIVFIIDECHRSQLGTMHQSIKKFFSNANYIGFTGTPIFEENKRDHPATTADLFSAGDKLDACLHRYMMQDAIADGYVLRFSIERLHTFSLRNNLAGFDSTHESMEQYCKDHGINVKTIYHDDKRIRSIADHIIAHHEQHTRLANGDTYTSLFAVDQISTLGKYYDYFKEINAKLPEDKRYTIVAIFTSKPNEDFNEGADEASPELLSRCMKDYNSIFGTPFTLNSFNSYRKDVMARIDHPIKPEQIDILLVVDMFLTGFDASRLNTLYIDKDLEWHTLIQAYSRTNRTDKKTKQFGQIVLFRDLQEKQDAALKLFSGGGDPNSVILESYESYVKSWRKQVNVLREVAPTTKDAGNLKSETKIREFITAFRALNRILSTLRVFTKFNWLDLSSSLSRQDFEDYQGWYRIFAHEAGERNPKYPVPMDVDFELELVDRTIIDVDYIKQLLGKITDPHTSPEERDKIEEEVTEILQRSNEPNLIRDPERIKKFVPIMAHKAKEETNVIKALEDEIHKDRINELTTYAKKKGYDVQSTIDIYEKYSATGMMMPDDLAYIVDPKSEMKYREQSISIDTLIEIIQSIYSGSTPTRSE